MKTKKKSYQAKDKVSAKATKVENLQLLQEPEASRMDKPELTTTSPQQTAS